MCIVPGRHIYSKYSVFLAFDTVGHLLDLLMYSIPESYENGTIAHSHGSPMW